MNKFNFKIFLHNLNLIFFRKHKISIILNYHRIGLIDNKNPFHRLHTVSLKVFKRQIKICSFLGKFVSLEDFYANRKKIEPYQDFYNTEKDEEHF